MKTATLVSFIASLEWQIHLSFTVAIKSLPTQSCRHHKGTIFFLVTTFLLFLL